MQWNYNIALKFARFLGSTAAETLLKFRGISTLTQRGKIKFQLFPLKDNFAGNQYDMMSVWSVPGPTGVSVCVPWVLEC